MTQEALQQSDETPEGSQAPTPELPKAPRGTNPTQMASGLVSELLSATTTVRLVRWGLYSVLFALAPFFLISLVLYTKNGSVPTLPMLFGHGELLLVAGAIAAAAVGEAVGLGTRRHYAQLFCVFGCLVCLAATTGLFTYVSPSVNPAGSSIPGLVSNVSIVIFAITLVASTGCMIMAELSK